MDHCTTEGVHPASKCNVEIDFSEYSTTTSWLIREGYVYKCVRCKRLGRESDVYTRQLGRLRCIMLCYECVGVDAIVINPEYKGMPVFADSDAQDELAALELDDGIIGRVVRWAIHRLPEELQR